MSAWDVCQSVKITKQPHWADIILQSYSAMQLVPRINFVVWFKVYNQPWTTWLYLYRPLSLRYQWICCNNSCITNIHICHEEESLWARQGSWPDVQCIVTVVSNPRWPCACVTKCTVRVFTHYCCYSLRHTLYGYIVCYQNSANESTPLCLASQWGPSIESDRESWS